MTTASPSELGLDSHDVQLSPFFWFVAAVGAAVSGGLLVPWIWWYSRRYPRSYDAIGMTTRGGRRLPWSSLESVNRVRVEGKTTGIAIVGDALHLQFPGLLIGANAALFRDGGRHLETMRAYIARARSRSPRTALPHAFLVPG